MIANNAHDRVAVYARYSTDRQDSRSIDDQIRRCRAHADARGFQVTATYSDAAVSGSHMEREHLQRLLADSKHRAFDCVLVDDLSRLSRDLGATWKIVFEDLAVRGVRVIDCTTGMSSDSAGARLTFGALALVNDTFLQLVRAETHRGLEGRALAGFATGGKTYGFSTVIEPNPPDLNHPRKVRVVVPEEAAIVLRIFEAYASGDSFKTIAGALNEEGVRAPHDGGKGNKSHRGWVHSTVRYMLRNEQYVGIWVWNKEKWVQVPGTRRYRRIARPPAEHVRKEIPDLRIVPQPLWEQVQTRIKRLSFNRSRGGRTPGTTRAVPSMLSGLLRCGVCGGSIAIVHRLTKNRYHYATLGCTTNKSRGTAICANSRTICDKKVRRAIVDMLTTHLTVPHLVQRFVMTFERRLDELQKTTSTHDDRAIRIRQQEAKIRNLYEGLAKMGWSQGLADHLRAEEATLTSMKALVTEPARVTAKVLPHPKIIEGYLRNLLTLVEGDPTRGREILARHVQPLVLTPAADGGYQITGAFNIATAIAAEDGRAMSDNGSRRDRD